jgi:hypothetical protein
MITDLEAAHGLVTYQLDKGFAAQVCQGFVTAVVAKLGAI